MSSTEPAAQVLWYDDHIVAVLKPAGVPVQPDKTGDPSLLDALRAHLVFSGAGNGPGIVHRLDRPVSGVLLIARGQLALSGLNAAFAAGSVRKEYWAVVSGTPPHSGEWTHRFRHDARAHKALACEPPDGREVRLRFRRLAQGDRYALMVLWPHGGMFHQLRAQCAAAGFPIKGDVKYGARRGEPDRSIALHARAVSFDHPITGMHVSVEAPAPSAPLWQALVNMTGEASVQAP